MNDGCLSNTKNSLTFVTGVAWCPMMRKNVRNGSRIEALDLRKYRGMVHGSRRLRTTQGNHLLQRFQAWLMALEV